MSILRMAKTSAKKSEGKNITSDVFLSTEKGRQPFNSVCLSPFGFVSKAIPKLSCVMGKVGLRKRNHLFGSRQKDNDKYCIDKEQEGGAEFAIGDTQIYSSDKEGNKTATITLRSNGNIEVKIKEKQIIIAISEKGEINIQAKDKINVSSDAEIEISGKKVKIIGSDTVEI